MKLHAIRSDDMSENYRGLPLPPNDFDNTNRQAAKSWVLPFHETEFAITLQPGAYLVDLVETVQVPPNCMTSLFPRSSLWRSAAGIRAGVVDAGYEGAIGALMEVNNPNGIVMLSSHKFVFEEMGEMVEGYSGIYQSSTSGIRRDGTAKA
ncbi:dUTPase [Drepanopeziza brunnea f. sp. 'multigermtubi' MB_m1]|uniref:dUTPase n=1 Tax=Marssonina brunnea f. sp. multigermtubi (strain MB_m1) TaxID=1072389 RepID=K1X9K8_MARBU|nr:dUTPase [Drepanopeziza brunnea f. sp. 'multigermtubi' MB_m1]EKD21657.1 dUTPase [Drepanopeziza brunnea f. sp. 'multigermtubi' MB_m1]